MTTGLELGDAFAFLARQKTNAIDAIITDPPYGLDHRYGSRVEEHKSPHTYEAWIKALWAECLRVVTPEGVIIIRQARKYWHYFARWFPQLDADLQMLYKDPVPDKGHYLTWAYDPLIVWCNWQRRAPHTPPPGYKAATHTDVFHADLRGPIRDSLRGRHPHPFPFGAAVRLITQYTLPGQLVVDPFMGSGTIPLAAKHCGRRFIGVDREPRFVRLAHQVFQEYEAEIADIATPTTTTTGEEYTDGPGALETTEVARDPLHRQGDGGPDRLRRGERSPVGARREDQLHGPARRVLPVRRGVPGGGQSDLPLPAPSDTRRELVYLYADGDPQHDPDYAPDTAHEWFWLADEPAPGAARGDARVAVSA